MARDPRGGVREIARLTRRDVGRPSSPSLRAREHDPGRGRRLRPAPPGQPGQGAASATGRPSGRPLPPLPPVPKPGRPRIRRIRHPGDQVHIMLGHLGVARNHPDFDALAVLDHIFGSGPGFCDRLGRIVRDELGLVYSIGGGMTDSADVVPGTVPRLRRHDARGGRARRRHDHRADPGDARRRLLRRRGRTAPAVTSPAPGSSTTRASNSGPSDCWSSSAGDSTSTSPDTGPSGSRRSRPARSAAPPGDICSPMRSAASSSGLAAAAASPSQADCARDACHEAEASCADALDRRCCPTALPHTSHVPRDPASRTRLDSRARRLLR